MLYDLNGTDDEEEEEAVEETPVGDAHAVPPAIPPAIPPAVKPEEAEPAGAQWRTALAASVVLGFGDAAI